MPGQHLAHLVKSLKNLEYILEATFFVQYSMKLGQNNCHDDLLDQFQSSRSHKIVRESRINEIKHVQTDKPLREFTHKNHRKRHFRPDRFS